MGTDFRRADLAGAYAVWRQDVDAVVTVADRARARLRIAVDVYPDTVNEARSAVVCPAGVSCEVSVAGRGFCGCVPGADRRGSRRAQRGARPRAGTARLVQRAHAVCG